MSNPFGPPGPPGPPLNPIGDPIRYGEAQTQFLIERARQAQALGLTPIGGATTPSPSSRPEDRANGAGEQPLAAIGDPWERLFVGCSRLASRNAPRSAVGREGDVDWVWAQVPELHSIHDTTIDPERSRLFTRRPGEYVHMTRWSSENAARWFAQQARRRDISPNATSAWVDYSLTWRGNVKAKHRPTERVWQVGVVPLLKRSGRPVVVFADGRYKVGEDEVRSRYWRRSHEEFGLTFDVVASMSAILGLAPSDKVTGTHE